MRRGLDGIYLLFGLRAVFKPRRGLVPLDFGGHSEGETPLPIPNRAVKPLSADGTWLARAWESRSPPVYHWAGRPDRGGPSALPVAPRAAAGSPTQGIDSRPCRLSRSSSSASLPRS